MNTIRNFQVHVGGIYAILSAIVGAVLSGIFTYYFAVNNDISREELLQKAEAYYKAEDYISAIEIYNNEKLENNIVALNNLTHIYKKYLSNNADYMSLARECVERMYNLDSQYLEEYIAFMICYPKTYNEVYWTLKKGVDNNIISAKRFIYACLKECGLEDQISVEQFCEMEYEDAIDILKRTTEKTYFEEIQGRVTSQIDGNDFYKIESTEIKRICVGFIEYDDSLDTDRLYGDISIATIEKTNFICDYIFINSIPFIELEEYESEEEQSETNGMFETD